MSQNKQLGLYYPETFILLKHAIKGLSEKIAEISKLEAQTMAMIYLK